MAVGISQTLADAWLNTVRGGGNGTSYTAPASLFLQAHNNTGDPGAAGTSNVSTAIAARSSVSYAAPTTVSTTRQVGLTATVSMSATGTETIAYLSEWTASTAGTFQGSATLTTPKAVANGDTLSITSFTKSLGTIAA